MIDDFSVNIDKAHLVTSLETDNIFKVEGSKLLNKNKANLIHTTVIIGLFLWKRARPDIQPTIAVYAIE